MSKPNTSSQPAALKQLLQPIGKVEHSSSFDSAETVLKSFKQNVWPVVVCTLMWLFGLWLSILGLWQADWLLSPFGLVVFGLMSVALYRLLPQLYSAPALFVGDKGILAVTLESTSRVLAHQRLMYSEHLIAQQLTLKNQTTLQIVDSSTGHQIVFTADNTDASASALIQAALLQTNAKTALAKRHSL